MSKTSCGLTSIHARRTSGDTCCWVVSKKASMGPGLPTPPASIKPYSQGQWRPSPNYGLSPPPNSKEVPFPLLAVAAQRKPSGDSELSAHLSTNEDNPSSHPVVSVEAMCSVHH